VLINKLSDQSKTGLINSNTSPGTTLSSVSQDGDAGVVGAILDQGADERLGCVDQLDL